MKKTMMLSYLILISQILLAIIINVPADQPTIQAGLYAATAGDTVFVATGTYVENITWPNTNSIKLIGEERENTIIDGNQDGRVIQFANGTDSSTVLTGFTITNGNAYIGGGIYCQNFSSPSLNNLIITNNLADYGGGGIFSDYSNPILENLTIINNSAVYGGGIHCSWDSNPSLENVSITNNSANYSGGGIYCHASNLNLENVMITNNIADNNGGGIYSDYCNLNMVNVLISDNSADFGGGLYCFNDSNPSLENVTITNNFAVENGGGIYCNSNSSPSLINCIFWNDSSQEIYFHQYTYPNTIEISYSDVQGGEAGIVTNNNGTVYWEEGNIDLDPLFIDPSNGDYTLTIDSPCIDAGDPSYPLDPDNTICDMGAFYYHQDQEIIVEEIYPEPGEITISEGDSINFYITANDPDGNFLEYIWELDSEIISTDSSFTFHTDENSAGSYAIALEVADNYQPPSRNTLSFEWDVIVEDVWSAQELVPTVTAIFQNYPNPFNPSTTIKYSLEKNSSVSLTIYNIKGQKVKQLVSDQLSRGQHSVVWNGDDENNKSVSSGIYFYKLNVNGKTEAVKKCILLK